MKPLYTDSQFENALSRELLPLSCLHCGETFWKAKNVVQRAIADTTRERLKYCSMACDVKQRTKPRHKIVCEECAVEFEKRAADMAIWHRREYKHHFCSSRCKGIYGAKTKTHGNRRSKLEAWIGERLVVAYPTVQFLFNDSASIGAELDVHIPTLKLAFELNGIFHYEPIFGAGKLEKMQSKDQYKLHTCTAQGIDLCVIDTSRMTYFKPKAAEEVLKIITDIIDDRLSEMSPQLDSNQRPDHYE